MNTFLGPVHEEGHGEIETQIGFAALETLGEPSKGALPCPRGSDVLALQVLQQLLPGQLVEISGRGGGGVLTLSAALLRRAQQQGESALWLSSPSKPFYAPDMAAAGVDLSALPVLLLESVEQACKASLRLLSSGGLGLLIWDLVSWKGRNLRLPTGLLSRLSATARHHRCGVLLLTEKRQEEPSAGCLVGLRLQVEALAGTWDLLEVRVVKDKRGVVGEGQGWRWRCGLPEGLPASAPLPAAVAAAPASRLAG